MQTLTRTFQTRLRLTSEQDAVLSAFCAAQNKVIYTLLNQLQKPKNSSVTLKRDYLPRFQINARHFNSARVVAAGMLSSVAELNEFYIKELQIKIDAVSRQIKNLQDPKVPKKLTVQRINYLIHQKKRKKHRLELKLLKKKNKNHTSVCLGSKDLFHKQFNLEENGYKNHAEWKKEWQQARNNQFTLIGSSDEVCGNSIAQLKQSASHTFQLRLTLPEAIFAQFPAQHKFFSLDNIAFAYGEQEIIQALQNTYVDPARPKVKKQTAMTYRLMRDEKSWRLMVSFAENKAVESRIDRGAVGIDVNIDHLAYTETDRFGNWIDSVRFNFQQDLPQGKNKAQLQELAAKLVHKIKQTGKPLVIEKLDFSKKKAAMLAEPDPKKNKMLSGFSYALILQSLKTACIKQGVEVIEVNPAFTSVIGAINYAQKKGISVHMAAALAIARRGLRFQSAQCVNRRLCLCATAAMSPLICRSGINQSMYGRIGVS